MPYDSNNKKLYIDKTTTPNKGISLSDIATALRDYRVNTYGRRDLGMLATSPNINKWSKNKPFVVSPDNDHPYGVQDDADRQAGGYGFYWQEFIGEDMCPIQRAAAYAFENGASHACEWFYNYPANIFRQQDFDGYLHTAIKPYEYEFDGAGDYDPVKKFVIKTDLVNDKIQLKLSNMPALTGDYDDIMEDLEIVAIIRDVESHNYQIVHTGMYGYDLDFGTGEVEVEFKCKPTIAGDEKAYELVWAAYNGKSVENHPVWIWLPYGYQYFGFKGYFSVKYSEYNQKLEIIDVNGRVLNSETQYPKEMSLRFDNFYNINSYYAGGEVILTVWNATSGSRQEFRYDLVNDGEMNLLEIDIQEAAGGGRVTDVMVTMDVYVRDLNVPVVTSPDYTAYHFNFLENKLELGVAETSDGVSLWDIYEYINS